MIDMLDTQMRECNNGSIWKSRLLCSSQLAKRCCPARPQGFNPLIKPSCLNVGSLKKLPCLLFSTGEITWKRFRRPIRNGSSRSLTWGEDLAQQQDFRARPPWDWLRNRASLQPGINQSVAWDNSSGVQSNCSPNFKHSKDGYTSIYHLGKGEPTV